MRAIRWSESLAQDLRYTARSLRRGPTFAAVATLALAIGIGATTALFGTVNATILRPLPYPQPEQLVSARSRLTSGQVTSGLLSPLNIAAARAIGYRTFVRKYSIVLTSPSLSATFGSHPSSVRARVMSGRRCFGSSVGSGL